MIQERTTHLSHFSSTTAAGMQLMFEVNDGTIVAWQCRRNNAVEEFVWLHCRWQHAPATFSLIPAEAKKKRKEKQVVMFSDPHTGTQLRLYPTMSLWYVMLLLLLHFLFVDFSKLPAVRRGCTRFIMYIGCPHLDNPRFHVVFWWQFRMPYSSFQDLVSFAEDHPLFERWQEGNVDALHQPATPLPLLLLCALRSIWRGWTFDDLTENTGISEEIMRVFFHRDRVPFYITSM